MHSFVQSFLSSSLLALSLGLALLQSCDKVAFDRLTGNLTFTGADGFASTSEGYVVSWKPATYDQDVSYSVYLLEAKDGAGLTSGLNGVPQDLQAKGTRVAKLYELGEGVGPAFDTAGSLITSQLDKNYYLIPPAYISQTKNYFIQVVAETADGKKSSGRGRAIYLFTDTIMKGTFYGCLKSEATGPDSISLTYQWPESAASYAIYRNGKQIYAPPQRLEEEMTYVDTELLQEGETYIYTCVATVSGENITGERKLTQKTLSTNPPIFAGIKNIAAYGSSGVTVSWNVPAAGSVRAASYQIYRSVGTSIDWSAAPAKTVSSSSVSATITGLGDELTYTFGVRACTSEPVCDTNTQTLQYTTPNTGAPITVGATEVALVNGAITITAPWDHTKGAIAKRYVYQKTGAASTNIANYTRVRTVTVSDRYNPSTALTVTGLSENTTYSFIVRDEDPAGSENTSTASVTMNTGDLTAPNFSGITALALGAGAGAENTLIASYTGVVRESVNPATGASAYLVYMATGNVDACSTGTLNQTITNTANAGDALTYSITGLSPRTTYSVCIKARDTAGNISNTTSYLPKTTLDTTAPYFDGVQTLTYNAAAGRMDVAWNASSSSDIYSYSVKVWKNSTSSSGATTFIKLAASYPSGFNFTSTDFTYAAGDVLYVKVDACDDAQLLSGGAQNCTNYADSTAKTLTVPDVVPPASFSGVAGSGSFAAPAEGQVTVAWIAPSSWTDYSGFKVYTVNTTDNSITLVKDCPCSSANCPNQITSCTVTGLNAYKTYYFHVRAYDDVGNLTTYVNPASSRTSYRTTDTTAPSFASSLQLTTSGGAMALSYSAATDNQGSEGSLSYKIYRKTSSTFATATNPSADGTLLTTKTSLTHSDTTGTTGTVYYYTVCAVDASNNTTCDGNVRSGTFPDTTAPTISSFTSNKTTDSQKEWTLSWSMSDNLTSTGSLKVRIYRSYTGSAGTATTSDTELTNAIGDTASIGSTSLAQVRGVAGTNTYINYLLRVEDDAGNATTSTLSVYSQNAITISSIWPASGVTAGSKYVVIDGTGIDDSATVTIGGNACTGKLVIRSGHKLACKTPPGMGANDVVITNPSGAGSATLASGYTYSNSVYCNVSSRASATPFANSSDGSGADGTSSKPYKICTFAQLDAIRTSASGGANKYWEFVEHIDASGQAFTPLTFNGSNSGFVNGGGYAVLNLSYTTSTAVNNIGLFSSLTGGYIKNLGVINASISYTGSASVLNWGILLGAMSGTNTYLDNVYTSGVIDVPAICTSNCATAGIAGSTNTATGYISNASNHAQIKGPSGLGGIVGRSTGLYSLTNSLNTGALTCRAPNSGSSGASCGGILGTGSSTASVPIMTNLTNTGDITLDTSTGSATYNVGGIAGGFYTYSQTLSGLVSTGRISGTTGTSVGGLIGIINYGTPALTVSNSNFSGKIDFSTSCSYCGGLIGNSDAGVIIDNSYSTGTLTGTSQMGGIIGRVVTINSAATATFTIQSSYSTMTLNSSSGSELGGLLGYYYCYSNCVGYTRNIVIQNSYFNGTINGSGYNIGGIVGRWGGNSSNESLSISRSYSKGQLASSASSVGGILGYVSASAAGSDIATVSISDSYSAMELSGPGNIGGIIGYFGRPVGSTVSGTIERSYFTGFISGASVYNGLIGTLQNSVPASCTDSFFSSTTTGTSNSGCSSGGTAKTTTQMQSSSTFANFDFTPTTGVWKMPSTTGFPMLIWE